MLEISDATFKAEVEGAGVPVVLDFSATWCGPCQRLTPIVEELSKEYAGKVKIAKLDIDASPETPTRFNIMAVPTILFFRGGKVVDQVQGLVPKSQLKNKIEALLS